VSRLWIRLVFTLIVCCGACCAQWELGLLGGGAMASVGTSISNGTAGSANSGFKEGFVGGALLGSDSNDHWAGEVRYLYRSGDAKLSSGSSEATFAAYQQIVHFDLLYHFQKRSSKVRFFVAAGGGGRFMSATGSGSAYQPLSEIAILTHGRQTVGVIDAGAGVKFKIGSRLSFRIEAHDYLSPAPSTVIAPVPGAKSSGWMSDIMPLAGLSYNF
jgi:hypothetical protein